MHENTYRRVTFLTNLMSSRLDKFHGSIFLLTGFYDIHHQVTQTYSNNFVLNFLNNLLYVFLDLSYTPTQFPVKWLNAILFVSSNIDTPFY